MYFCIFDGLMSERRERILDSMARGGAARLRVQRLSSLQRARALSFVVRLFESLLFPALIFLMIHMSFGLSVCIKFD